MEDEEEAGEVAEVAEDDVKLGDKKPAFREAEAGVPPP